MRIIGESSGKFGVARVFGLESCRADDASVAGLRAALAQHAVLCVHMDRTVDETRLRTVAEWFGPIKVPVGRSRAGGQFRYAASCQLIDSGSVQDDEASGGGAGAPGGALDDRRAGLSETFHVDDIFTEDPAAATVLQARVLPTSGNGLSCFIDMRAAYQGLDPALKARLEGLRAVYAYNNHDAFAPARRSAAGPAEVLIEVSHPLVRTHPVTGTKALYLDLARAMHIDGLPIAEGRELLQSLQDHAERTAPYCEHRWQDHDVLVWDNASVQHKAASTFKFGEHLLFWRYLVAGPVPV